MSLFIKCICKNSVEYKLLAASRECNKIVLAKEASLQSLLTCHQLGEKKKKKQYYPFFFFFYHLFLTNGMHGTPVFCIFSWVMKVSCSNRDTLDESFSDVDMWDVCLKSVRRLFPLFKSKLREVIFTIHCFQIFKPTGDVRCLRAVMGKVWFT